MRLRDKVAIITGGGSGIGRETALRFVEEGARVALFDINGENLEEVKKITGALSIEGDVSQLTQVNKMVDTVVNHYGKIDILVNAAGIIHRAPLWELEERDWDRVIAINQKGTFLCAQAAARYMMKQRSGRIINISSKFAFQPPTNRAHYAASKAAVAGLTRAFAIELAPYGITVNAVAPGTIETPMTRPYYSNEEWEQKKSTVPLGRCGKPRDVADLIVFLASEESSFITGQIIHINGGSFMT